jgi:hypothetical protein
VFGRRKREEAAAAEAAREAERRALFAKLAERPEHICPFLGLADDRAGYVYGVSDEHRCFAFGDPAPLSAEQQTRVCQERGYGNCPRYLRGVLVIPTEELEALRRPRAPLPEPVVVPAGEDHRRRRAPVFLVLALLLLVAGGVGTVIFFLGGGGGVAFESATPDPTQPPTPTPSAATSDAPTASIAPSSAPASASVPASIGATPTPEATPQQDDVFAFYEVSVGPQGYILFDLTDANEIGVQRGASFENFSVAPVRPVVSAEERVLWLTTRGDLAGWAYMYPESGDFNIRQVFQDVDGNRSGSQVIDQDDLGTFPETDPTPRPSP